MPGQFKYYVLYETSLSCNLLVDVAKVTEEIVVGNVTLNFYLRIGDYPKVTEYDYHISIQYRPSSIGAESNSSATDYDEYQDGDKLHFKKLGDNSFLMFNLSGLLEKKEQLNASTVVNETAIYLGLTYEGLMPPLELITNPYTYDVLEKRGQYVFKVTTSCAECRFWNESSLQWMTEGLEVSHKRMLFYLLLLLFSLNLRDVFRIVHGAHYVIFSMKSERTSGKITIDFGCFLPLILIVSDEKIT